MFAECILMHAQNTSEFVVHKLNYLKKTARIVSYFQIVHMFLFCATSSPFLISFCRDCLQVCMVCGAAFSSRVVPAEVSGFRAMLNTRKKLVKENVIAGGNWDARD